jgi:hypothetical protein
MKNKLTLLTLIFSMICLTASAQFTAYWQFSDFGLNPQTIKNVIIQPQWTVNVFGGTNTIPGTKQIYQTTSSGIITQSNMIPGSYKVQFTGSDGSVFTFTNLFGTNVTGYVNGSAYIGVSTNVNTYLYFAGPPGPAGPAGTNTAGFQTNWPWSSITNPPSIQTNWPWNAITNQPLVQTNWSVASITNAGTAAYSNAAAFDPAGTALAATNAFNNKAAYSSPGAFDAAGAATAATSSLANTNGTYPLMTVGNATTAAGGWPTTWAWSSITGQPFIVLTNGTYPNMTVGAATTASGGWPTTWPSTSITSPPWATNTPAGIVAAEGFQPATNAASIPTTQITGLGTAAASSTNQFLQAGTNANDASPATNLNASQLVSIGNTNTGAAGNFFLGNAGNSTMTGGSNYAAGYQSFAANTTGYLNTDSGAQSLHSNTSGYNNAALGYQALFSETGANANSAFGAKSLFSDTTGSGNTAEGYYSIGSCTTGMNNTSVGDYCLQNVSTGSSNTAIGYIAGKNITTGGNNIDIGANVSGLSTDTNITRIGNVQTDAYIAGNTHITGGISTTSSNLLAVQTISVGGSPFSWTNTTTLNVNVFIGGATTSSLALNGTTIFGTLSVGTATVPLQPNEYFTLTYTGSPTALYKPW